MVQGCCTDWAAPLTVKNSAAPLKIFVAHQQYHAPIDHVFDAIVATRHSLQRLHPFQLVD